MSLKETKKLYNKLVKKGVINKDIKMPLGNFMSFPLEEVKKLFNNVSKYNAKEDVKKIYEKIK